MVVLFSAQQHGLLCEVDSDEENENKELCDPFFAHCKAHADKDIAKRKVRKDVEQVVVPNAHCSCSAGTI